MVPSHHLSRTLVVVVSAGLLASVSAPARGQGFLHEMKVGVLDHDVPDLWSGFRAEPRSVALNAEALLTPSVSFLGGTIRPAFGGSLATSGGGTSNIYLDARWQYEFGGGLFLGFGIGGTIHDGQLKLVDWDRKALGSRVLFHFPLEIGWRFDGHNSISVYFEHMSNAYTVSPNEGLDRIGIRYGYRF